MKVQEKQVKFILIVILSIAVIIFGISNGFSQDNSAQTAADSTKKKVLTTAGNKIPLDKYGKVDWVKLKEKGLINPKWTLDPNPEEEEETEDTVIFFESKSDDLEDVLFSHQVHTDYLNCDSCHDTQGGKIFEDSAGENEVLMKDMKSEKKWCGRCHSTVAFPLKDCQRCHTVSKGTPKDEDWSLREEE